MAVTETGEAASRALDDLYRRHAADVYRYSLAVLGNRADAEDVTQTTFLNAYRALEQGVRPRKPSNWLLTIASNAIKQRFRQESSRPRQVELDERIASASAEEDGPTVGEILVALSRIPPQQRQAIVLREFEGRSYAEIAQILGVTTSALETLLFRARRSLAEEIVHNLSCTEAQQAISRAADGRLGRKEKRRLREHLDECADCTAFARLQRRNRGALRSLLLLPVPVSIGIFKGLEGSAAAATVPAAGLGAAAATSGAGAVAATSGIGATSAAGGGLLAGGVVLKSAAVVAAATVATGGVVGASEISAREGPKSSSPALVKPGKSATAPGRAVTNGRAVGKATAPGQARARGGPAPGQVRKQARATSPKRDVPARGNGGNANGRGVIARGGGNAARPAKPPKPARPAKPAQVEPPMHVKPPKSARSAKPTKTSGPAGGAKSNDK